ncbi:MAG: hypothetical protein KGH78_03045 [Candidatus Micrarchaeota archaeon]|nr:hypothetical protein [Candidatus Micrarchaeota archaeon]MDE1846570.1 hypothetical protein [Candidatus Micrarchaeota archaeon]
MKFFFGHRDKSAKDVAPQQKDGQEITKSYEPIYAKRMKIENGIFTKEQLLDLVKNEKDVYLVQVYIAKLAKEKMLDNGTTVALISLFKGQVENPKPSWHVMSSVLDALLTSDTSDEYKLTTFKQLNASVQDMEPRIRELIRMEINIKMNTSCTLLQAQRDQKPEYE